MFRRIDVNCVTYERSCARPRVTAVPSGCFPRVSWGARKIASKFGTEFLRLWSAAVCVLLI